MFNIYKLKGHAYANAHVRVYNDGKIELISYTTLVCTITPYGCLTCTGTYSPTTRKHIGYFLKEYMPQATYYTAKKCAEYNVGYNTRTGEYVSNETGEILNI